MVTTLDLISAALFHPPKTWALIAVGSVCVSLWFAVAILLQRLDDRLSNDGDDRG